MDKKEKERKKKHGKENKKGIVYIKGKRLFSLKENVQKNAQQL